ncbi:MAG: ABC transporter substrate-binding protein [Muribaculaceae bacterium]|nr:ABC transporter substrate-binding protein [Muribaculaceae bacterium]
MALFKNLIMIGMCLLLLSCGGGHKVHLQETEIPLEYASYLKMSEGDGYTHVIIRNPWDTTKILHSYILVPDSLNLSDEYPEGTLIRTPIKQSVVFSSVHGSLLDELESIGTIKGVCDAEYLNNPTLVEKLKNNSIADCGSSMAPDVEKIISLRPDAVLLSPYQDKSSYTRLIELGVPIIECADYMETNPLGRAEWVKFYAALVGKKDKGDAIFNNVKSEYEQLKSLISKVSFRPKVLTELKQGDSWFLPAKSSTMGILIEDAGGKLPDIVEGEGGSKAYTPEKVLVDAADSKIWLIKYFSDNELTYNQLSKESPIYKNIDAFKKKNIYACNTSKKQFYEEVPFHPHWLLADFISIFHPESGVKPYPGKSYYSRLSD